MKRDLAYAGPDPRAVCRRCLRPVVVCYCAALTTIDTRTRVVILQHPRERGMPIGTARMATLCLPSASLHVGVRWDDSDALRDATGDPSRPAILLYPGPGARDVLLDPPTGPVTLVMVDGTWPQAKTLVRDNPRLASLPRFAFTPPAASEYRIRREPREDYVSTIEALMHVLGALERDPPRFRALLEPLRAMVDRQIERSAAHRTPRKMRPRPKRLGDAPVPREVLERFDDLVCVAAEGNGRHYAATGVKEGHELLHWAAVRAATGETLDLVAAQARPPAPGTTAHARIDDARVAGGVSREDLRAASARFLRPSDVVCSWGAYAPALFEETIGPLPAARLDVRLAARARAGVAGSGASKVGTLETYSARGAPAAAPSAEPRATRRAALLSGVLRAWRDERRGE